MLVLMLLLIVIVIVVLAVAVLVLAADISFKCAQIESEFWCSAAAPIPQLQCPTRRPFPVPLLQQQLQTTQQCRKANKN